MPPAPPPAPRPKPWLPWAGAAGWAAGAVALGAAARAGGWSTGEWVLAAAGWLVVGAVAARGPVGRLFGPVFAYEMLRLGRKRLTFALRGLYVVAVSGMLALMYLSWLEDTTYLRSRSHVSGMEVAQFATRFFFAFQFLQFAVIALITPAYVAPAVADEKERKTLEFLLATDLRNREIVFGKLAARVATLLMYVLAGLPVLAFLQLFGGIDPELLLAGTAATVVTAVGLSALSLCVSVAAKRAREAIAFTYVAAVLYAVAGPMLVALVRNGIAPFWSTTVTAFGTTVDWAEGVEWLAAGNPVWLVLDSARGAGGGTAWVGGALTRYAVFWGVATVVLLTVAVARLRSVALRQAYGGSGRRRWRRAGTGAKRRAARPAVGDNPVFWKEVFVDGGGRGGMSGVFAAVALYGLTFAAPALVVWITFGDYLPGVAESVVEGIAPGVSEPGAVRQFVGRFVVPYSYDRGFVARWHEFERAVSVWVRIATGILGSVALLAVAVRGSGAVSGERDRDTWISLVSTPLSAWDILIGKWWGCVLSPRKLYTVILVVWATGLAVGAVKVAMLPAMLLAFGVYVAAFGWLGVFCSVTARRTLVATVRAILAAVFVGGGFWVAFGLCCVLPFQLLFSRMGGRMADSVAQLLLGMTPPVVLGWLPLRSFDRFETSPFSPDHNDGMFGPLAPVAGLVVWVVSGAVLASVSWSVFRGQTNRDSQPVRRARPRPVRRSGPPHTDAGNPSR